MPIWTKPALPCLDSSYHIIVPDYLPNFASILLRTTIKELPVGTPSVLRNGLLEAHRKLSEYYYKFDQSPFYTWAARTF